MVIFSMVASLNNIIWNTWGPIQGTAKVVYGWNDATIALLADWGPISYVVAALPMSWLMSEKGKSRKKNQIPSFRLNKLWYVTLSFFEKLLFA